MRERKNAWTAGAISTAKTALMILLLLAGIAVGYVTGSQFAITDGRATTVTEKTTDTVTRITTATQSTTRTTTVSPPEKTVTTTQNQTVETTKTIWGIDLFGNYSQEALAPCGYDAKDAGEIGRSFYSEHADVVPQNPDLFGRVGKDLLVYASNRNLYAIVKDISSKDRQFKTLSAEDKRELLLDEMVDLDYDRAVPSVSRQVINVIGNSTIHQRVGTKGYAELDLKRSIGSLLLNPEAADIRPIPILNLANETEYLPENVDYDLAYWILLTLLENRTWAATATTGEEIATKVLVNQYDLSRVELTPIEIAQIVVRQWDLVPKIGERLLRNVSNETDRKVVLYYKWQLPTILWDQKTGKYYDGKEAIDVFLQRVEEGYDGKILAAYPNGIPIEKYDIVNVNPRLGFYEWFIDRGRHGLSNSVGQFIGDWKTFDERWNKAFELYNWREQSDELLTYLEDGIKNLPGIHQYLSKNCPVYDKIMYFYPYVGFYEGEWQGRRGGLKIVFTLLDEPISYAYPVGHFVGSMELGNANVSKGAYGYEFGIAGIPDTIIQPVLQGRYGKVLKVPGNMYSLLTMQDGIEKDITTIDPNNYPLLYSAAYIPKEFTELGDELETSIYLYRIGRSVGWEDTWW